jgi:hypothetical protein
VTLRERFRHLDGQTVLFEDRCAEADKRWLRATEKTPAELIIRKADRRLFKQFFRDRWRERTFYDKHDVADMRGRKVKQNRDRYVRLGVPIEERELPFSERFDPPGVHGVDFDYFVERVPWPLAQARLDSIVTAHDRWQADKAALHIAMGNDAADEALDAHQDKVDEALEEMVTAPATTIAALQMKAGLMSEWLDDNEDQFENWRAIVLVRSILEDIAKLEG